MGVRCLLADICDGCYSCLFVCGCVFFFFKQKTAYEMRISDWSSDVCSSDLRSAPARRRCRRCTGRRRRPGRWRCRRWPVERRKRRFRSEERRVGKECAVRVDLGGRRIIKKKTTHTRTRTTTLCSQPYPERHV